MYKQGKAGTWNLINKPGESVQSAARLAHLISAELDSVFKLVWDIFRSLCFIFRSLFLTFRSLCLYLGAYAQYLGVYAHIFRSLCYLSGL